jgi:hypothetical protein
MGGCWSAAKFSLAHATLLASGAAACCNLIGLQVVLLGSTEVGKKVMAAAAAAGSPEAHATLLTASAAAFLISFFCRWCLGAVQKWARK